MAYFDSVFKSTEDFFKKSFSKDNVVEFSGKLDNGVKVTLEGGVKTAVKVDKATKAESVSKTGSTTVKVEYKKGAVSLDKFEVASAGTVKADISLPTLVPNTKFTFKAEDGSSAKKAIKGVIGVETTQDVGAAVGVKADIDAVGGNGNFSLLLKHSGVLVGGSAAFSTPLGVKAAPAPAAPAAGGDAPAAPAKAGFALSEYDAVLGYTTGAATFGVQTGKKFNTVTGYVHAEVAPSVTVAGKATYTLGSKAAPITGSVGGSLKVDKEVTLYGAVAETGVVQGAAALGVGSNATLSLYATVNALKIEEDGKHFFGTKLALRG